MSRQSSKFSANLLPLTIAALLLSGAAAFADSAAADSAFADEAEGGFKLPPRALVDIVDQQRTPQVRVSPDRRWLLLLQQTSMPGIAELAEEELRLAGFRINPRHNGPSRRRSFSGLELVRIEDGLRLPVRGLPEGPRVDDVEWSPDSSRLAFTVTRSEAVELWVAEVATGEARRATDAPLSLAPRGSSPVWTPDSRSLVCALIPEGRGPAPVAPTVPVGPVIQESSGKSAPSRTYQDLLQNPHDEALFEHYLRARIARVDLDGKVTRLGEPGLVWGFDPSPDGRYLLVEMLHRPFSYLVPAARFPRRIEVWSRTGELVRRVADKPLQDSIPLAFGSVSTGPRGVEWRSDTPATLAWVEALDGGDAGMRRRSEIASFCGSRPSPASRGLG